MGNLYRCIYSCPGRLYRSHLDLCKHFQFRIHRYPGMIYHLREAYNQLDMHIGTNRQYSGKRPNINCTLCGLHIRQYLRMSDCYHSNGILDYKRIDNYPSNLYNVVRIGPAFQHIHRYQHNFYHRVHSF